MWEYNQFKYLYPPRPEFVLTSDRIPFYEKDGWVGQYKMNGTNTILAMSPEGSFTAMNRHNEEHRAWQLTEEIKTSLRQLLPKGSWTVLVGEIMHSKTPTIKNTIYFHDVLVHQSKHLVGMTFKDRQILLEKLLPSNGKEDKSHYFVTDRIWRAKLITKNIHKHFVEIEDPKILEGFVLKLPTGKLKPCYTENNNTSWQYKIRYPTKNYQF